MIIESPQNNKIANAAKQLVESIKNPRRRFHMTDLSKIHLRGEFDNNSTECFYKPHGLWYGIETSWIDWCLGNQPDWIGKYIWELQVDEKNIIRIDSISDFEKFEEEFTIKNDRINLNMPLLSSNYHGLEISQYFSSKRLSSFWYYGWDCASGCIWNTASILEMKLFAEFDEQKGCFLKPN